MKPEFENDQIVELPWSCNFGPSLQAQTWCEFVYNEHGQGNFTLHDDQTPSLGTGPHMAEISQHGQCDIF